MKDILVVAKLNEGKFEKFMGFMQSEEINERRIIADLTKTLGTVSPDKSAVILRLLCTIKMLYIHFWMAQILYQKQFLMRLLQVMRFLS